jgi:hypothetical protein
VAVLLDTGPWVALLRRNDTHHRWAVEPFRCLPPPLLSCDAVVAETCFLLARSGFDPALALPFIAHGAVPLPCAAGADQPRPPPVQARRECAGLSSGCGPDPSGGDHGCAVAAHHRQRFPDLSAPWPPDDPAPPPDRHGPRPSETPADPPTGAAAQPSPAIAFHDGSEPAAGEIPFARSRCQRRRRQWRSENLRTWFCSGCVAASPEVEGSESSMAFGTACSGLGLTGSLPLPDPCRWASGPRIQISSDRGF